MTVSSCGKGSKSGGGGTTGGKAIVMPARLTITGLPEQDFDVYVAGMDINLSSITAISSAKNSFEAIGTQASHGGNVFIMTAMGAWSASGKRKVILVSKDYNQDNPADKNNPAARTATVDFTMGGATVKFSSFAAVTKQ